MAKWLVIMILMPFAAHAAAPGSSGEPIEITADKLEVRQDQQIAIFSGNVVATQGEFSMKAAVMNVYYREDASGGDNEIRKIDASGRVNFATTEETADGNKALYLVDEEKIYLTGDVVLTREKNILKGEKLEYNVATGRSIITGDTKATVGGKDTGRVRGVFVPKQKEQ